jgi:hypothetical protein
LMPVIVALLETIGVLSGTLTCGVKENAFTVVADVVTVNVALTVEMVSVALAVAPDVLEAVSRTATVLPLEIVPAALVNAPPFRL